MKRVPVARPQEQQRPDLCLALLDENLDDLVEQYLTEIGPIPLLTAEEERALALRIREGDAAAKQRFIEANRRADRRTDGDGCRHDPAGQERQLPCLESGQSGEWS